MRGSESPLTGCKGREGERGGERNERWDNERNKRRMGWVRVGRVR
jgi:hypothetical protein